MSNTLTVLSRVHKYLAARTKADVDPYAKNEIKKIVVIGVCNDHFGSSINHLSALTCETPEKVHTFVRCWRRMPSPEKAFWIAVAEGKET